MTRTSERPHVANDSGALRPSIPKLSTHRPTPARMAGALCAVGLVAACGSKSNLAPGQSSVSSQDAPVGLVASPDRTPVCDPTFNPSTIEAGLTRPGSSSALTFVLVSADSPPKVEYNRWTVKVLDAAGDPVTDATFPEIKTWMPLHGHASSVAPTYTSNGDGTYTINFYLFMPGLWQITPTAQTGVTTDQTVFTFCVGG